MHLAPREELDVREHQFLAATVTIGFTWQRVQGVANVLLGGLNLAFNRFTGPRRIGLQSMSVVVESAGAEQMNRTTA